jgi:hypothetical protein
MSKAAWKTLFGLKLSRWAGRDPDRRPLPEDCDVVLTASALRAAGVKNVTRGRLKLSRDPRYHRRTLLLPDGRREDTTHQTSLNWIVEVMSDEGCARSRANLMVGGQVLETTVTKQQGSFVPEVWRVPVAPRAPRAYAPVARGRRVPSAGRPADPAAAVAPRNDDPELEKEMRKQLHEDARRLLATTGPLDLAAIAAGLRLLTREGRVALARALRNTDGTIIGVPGEGEGGRLLYQVRAP